MAALPLVAVVTAAALVQVDEPNTLPAATLRLVGKLSVKLMPDWAGLVPVLVKVKRSVVVAPSTKVDGMKALVSTGGMGLTLKQALLPPTIALVAVMLATRLVWLACGQVPVMPTALVRPATVTVQLVVPLVMARPVKPLRTRLPVL